MTERFFVDTNILVYARDGGDIEKQRIAKELLARLWEDGSGRISYQVLAEYFVVLSLKYKVKDSLIFADLQDFESWQPCAIDRSVFSRTQRLQQQYNLAWWDCQIIAAAEYSQCGTLFTEDLSAGAVYGTVKVVNPFKEGRTL